MPAVLLSFLRHSAIGVPLSRPQRQGVIFYFILTGRQRPERGELSYMGGVKAFSTLSDRNPTQTGQKEGYWSM